MPKTAIKPPPIPRKYTRARDEKWWGGTYRVKPATATQHTGDGKLLLAFQPLNTRPNYYLIRVDSGFFDDGDDDDAEELIDILSDEFSEKEREREWLAEELRAAGIEPTAENTDLNGNEDRLGWPVLSLDSGWEWWEVARL